jgi:hypothetical protein
MRVLAPVLALGFLVAGSAAAAPGDPRLMHGTLEWPATLSGEPFVVVRGDDGRLYAVDVGSAHRRIPGALTAGARIALLGVEGAKSQEITALAIGVGDAGALVRAITSGGAGAPSNDAPVAEASAPAVAAPLGDSPPAAPSPSRPPDLVTRQSSPSAAPERAAVAPPAPPATPIAAPPAGAPTIAAVAAPPTGAPSITAVAAPPAGAPTIATVAVPPTVSRPEAPNPVAALVPSSAAAAPVSSVPLPPAPAPDGGRWLEVRGVVHSVSGRTLVLLGDDGHVFAVDLSELSPSLAEGIKPGTAMSVFGDPLEIRFRARGVIHSEERPAAQNGPVVAGPRKPAR